MRSDNDWTKSRLISALKSLGYPEELGNGIAKNLGSPKAMECMIAYLSYVKPKKIVMDEMLAIKSEIDDWREKKASEEANAKYNEMLYYGLTEE